MEINCILPDDLWEEILSRLPVRHLLQLRCVSKPWRALIDNYSLMKKHYQFQYDISKAGGDVPLITDCIPMAYGEDPTQFYIVSKQQGEVVVSNLTPDLHRDIIATHFTNNDPDHIFNTLCCFGVVNGIVLLQWGRKHLGLWNPATKEFKLVTHCPIVLDKPSKTTTDTWCLGFDPVSDDFKIVANCFGRVFHDSGKFSNLDELFSENNVAGNINLYKMYSLSTNSWKRIEEPPTCVMLPTLLNTDGYLNGVYYWACHNFGCDRAKNPFQILSFNFTTEMFTVFDSPEGARAIMASRDDFNWKVGLYKECVAAIVSHMNGDRAVFCVAVWIVTKFDHDHDRGVQTTWQHLFTIDVPFSEFHGCEWYFMRLRMDGELLLAVQNGSVCYHEVIHYNPQARTLKKLGIDFGANFRYVEGLFPLSKRISLASASALKT